MATALRWQKSVSLVSLASIDIDAATDEAVITDGASHFLGTYDGNSYTTDAGLVYWRMS